MVAERSTQRRLTSIGLPAEAHDTRERIRSEAHRDRNFTPQRNGFELDGHSIIALFEPSDAILLEFSARQQSRLAARLAALEPFANWNWGCIPS